MWSVLRESNWWEPWLNPSKTEWQNKIWLLKNPPRFWILFKLFVIFVLRIFLDIFPMRQKCYNIAKFCLVLRPIGLRSPDHSIPMPTPGVDLLPIKFKKWDSEYFWNSWFLGPSTVNCIYQFEEFSLMLGQWSNQTFSQNEDNRDNFLFHVTKIFLKINGERYPSIFFRMPLILVSFLFHHFGLNDISRYGTAGKTHRFIPRYVNNCHF